MKNGICKAHGKINLHLQVLDKRDDGFHNIFSLMAELSLFDILKLQFCDFDYRGDDVTVEIVSSGGVYSHILSMVSNEDNLVSIAVKNYLKKIGVGGKFLFEIEKNLPAGAGLGGGSSDAASALRLVQDALGRGDDDILTHVATMTGSDVAFFMSGGLAFAQGRGEILDRINFKLEGNLVLVNNGIKINTGVAYGVLNRSSFDQIDQEVINERKVEILDNLNSVRQWGSLFKNDFEEAVFRVHPELKEIKNLIYDLGAQFASMTGSGSTIFGVFENVKDAQSAVGELRKKGNEVFLANFI